MSEKSELETEIVRRRARLAAELGRRGIPLDDEHAAAISVPPYSLPAERYVVTDGSVTLLHPLHLSLALALEEGRTADVLYSIDGGVDGTVLILRLAQEGVALIVSSGKGNVSLPAGDLILSSPHDALLLVYDGPASLWRGVILPQLPTPAPPPAPELVYVGPFPPAAPAIGTIWLDTTR
jgi:hypothetical protein